MEFPSLKNILLMTPILLIALPVHEFAHAWVACKMGDPTAKYAGRLTLNPFRHLDLLGVVMMYTVGFGWAKPVPVNSVYFRNRRAGMILVSLAGPVSNLLLGFISMFAWGIIVKLVGIRVILVDTEGMTALLSNAEDFFRTLILVNISLAIFNLFPIPPLDGSRLISAFVPEESYYRFARYEQYIGLVFLAIVVLVPNNFIGKAVGFFAVPIYNSMVFATRFLLGL